MLSRFNTALLVALALSQIARDTGGQVFAVGLPIFFFGAWMLIDGKRLKRKLDRRAAR